ncbi:MAG: DNA polymerase III subunit beta [Bacteroidota bacterium]|nr:DNA polymerase III subunit beta [Bacteroidota bacterium]
MKFTVSASALLKHLQINSGALSSNPVIPVLEDFLLTLKGNTLEIATSNLEMTILSEMEVNGSKDGIIAIPGRTLLETLKSMPEQPLVFSINEETLGVEITSAVGNYKLIGEKAEDFPEIPKPDKEDKINLETLKIQRAIDKTIFAVSNDEMRQGMKGLCFNIDFNHLTVVATDAHKMVKFAFLDVKSDVASTIILTKKAMLALRAILPKEGTVDMFFSKTMAFFTFDKIRFITRLIEAKFPDYNAVIPTNNTNKLKVNRLELLSALRRLSIFANKTTHQVVLNIQDNSLTISAQDRDLQNEGTEQVICTYEGEPCSVGLNARFVIEMLSALDSEMAHIELSSSNRPALILPSEQESNEDLLMLVVTNY